MRSFRNIPVRDIYQVGDKLLGLSSSGQPELNEITSVAADSVNILSAGYGAHGSICVNNPFNAPGPASITGYSFNVSSNEIHVVNVSDYVLFEFLWGDNFASGLAGSNKAVLLWHKGSPPDVYQFSESSGGEDIIITPGVFSVGKTFVGSSKLHFINGLTNGVNVQLITHSINKCSISGGGET